MARAGRPGTIRGEAARRGISEYQVRKERETQRALAEKRAPDYVKAAGKTGHVQRRQLDKLLQQAYPKGTASYDKIKTDMLWTYKKYGFDVTRDVLVTSGLNVQYYLHGATGQLEWGKRVAKSWHDLYPDIPESMFWYHGVLS